MAKAQDAFRTISEVADELAVQKHVLRFWENKFPHIRPMKRGGGRRFYRPDDLDLLRGIRYLLHREGYTIKGVQKILREQGPEHVKACWQLGVGSAKSAELVTQMPPVLAAHKTALKPVPASKVAGKAVKPASKAVKPTYEELVTQLERLTSELEAAQAILRGQSQPRRALAPRTAAPAQITAAKAAPAKTAAVKAAPAKKARGR
jgi:DNA-binding transcriptional MerR regulator